MQRDKPAPKQLDPNAAAFVPAVRPPAAAQPAHLPQGQAQGQGHNAGQVPIQQPAPRPREYNGRIGQTEYHYDPNDRKYYDAPDGGNELATPETEYEVGAGDFSAARGRQRLDVDADRQILRKATVFESEADVRRRPNASANIAEFEEMGGVVKYNVDATAYGQPSAVPGKEPMSPRNVRRVRFDHPHTGEGSAGRSRDERDLFIRSNQRLIRGYMAAASQKGERVSVTTNDSAVYNDWNVEGLAQAEGLQHESNEPFVAPPGSKYVATDRQKGKVKKHKTSTVRTWRRNQAVPPINLPAQPPAQQPVAAQPPPLRAPQPFAAAQPPPANQPQMGGYGQGGFAPMYAPQYGYAPPQFAPMYAPPHGYPQPQFMPMQPPQYGYAPQFMPMYQPQFGYAPFGYQQAAVPPPYGYGQPPQAPMQQPDVAEPVSNSNWSEPDDEKEAKK